MVQALEVAAAIIVTAGLVAGNLILFSPLRSDERGQSPNSNSREAETIHSPSTAADSPARFDSLRVENEQGNKP